MRKSLIFSSFIIKIVALVTMTFDHVGLLLRTLYPYNYDITQLSNVFRSIGRLALPLFVFMIIEGVIHTKNFKKYILRLGIMAIIISGFLALITYVDFGIDASSLAHAGNIFIDLLLVALSAYLLGHKKIWVKLLSLLPIAVAITCFIVKGYQYQTGEIIYWYPNWLYLQYDWFSLLLGVGFFFAYKLGQKYIAYMEDKNGMPKEVWDVNGNQRLLVNIINVFVLMISSLLFYSMKFIWQGGVYWDASNQLLAILSGALILLYNGKRGYNAKWFQYGAYLYYPLHILIIILVAMIASGGY